MSLIDMMIFAITLHASVGYDQRPGEVPLEYGSLVYTASVHHGMDPFEVGAILLAENKGRDYDPTQMGRYNGKGKLLDPNDPRPREAGLFQLMPVWAREVTRRCSSQDVLDLLNERYRRFLRSKFRDEWHALPAAEYRAKWKAYQLSDEYRSPRYTKKARHLYVGGVPAEEGGELAPACLWIPSDKWVAHVEEKDETVNLLDPKVNVEAAVLTFQRLQLRMRNNPGETWDWRPRFRCAPGYQYTKRCVLSVTRVAKWERTIRVHHLAYRSGVLAGVEAHRVGLHLAGYGVVGELWRLSLGESTLDSSGKLDIVDTLRSRYVNGVRSLRKGLIASDPS